MALVTLLVWCALEAGVRRSDRITDDWHGWRQADTQAIARNFLDEGFVPWKPRIDWRGDGPGYVEAELQVYTTLVAVVMLVTGESVWPGQLLSLTAVAAAGWVLFRALRRRFGDGAAFVALVAMLATKGVVVVATSIQPDALALVAYVVGFVAFRDYLDCPGRRHLIVWTGATMLAGLIKPPLLELGIAQVVLVVLLRPAWLKSWQLWVAWICVLAGVAAHLLYARELYIAYGNTFGVLSGGDSKLPVASALLSGRVWFDLARFEVVWGTGVFGAAVAAYRLATRTWAPEEVALALAALASSTLALRYTSSPFGTHYHLPHVVLGAWLVARAVAGVQGRLATPYIRAAAAGAFSLFVVLQYSTTLRAVLQLPRAPETEVGQMLADAAPPGTLVLVRARAPRFEPEWRTVNNFEDPRVFYLSRTKGWVLPNDHPGAAPLAEAASRGARFYAHVNQMPVDSDMAAWLKREAEMVATSPAGVVYRLRQSLTK